MIILSNCLTDVVDEGGLKVATSLAKRIKQADERVTVVTFRRHSKLSDLHLNINKLLLSKDLFRLLRTHREPVLYLPFPTRTLPTALRIFLLSHMSREPVNVVLTITSQYNWLGRLLMRMNPAHLVALSAQSARFYADMVGQDRVTYLKSGVDTKRFTPVTPEYQAELKKKYGLDPAKKTILHVGHMKEGRNVAELMKLDSCYQALLVVSTFTSPEQDLQLRERIEACENIKVIDQYIPNIEEIYQLSDAYFFPVLEQGNCIDIPLSCLEAAACGKPVITTKYGEMAEFVGKPGFYFLQSMDSSEINQLVDRAVSETECQARGAVLDYDWDHAVQTLLVK